MSTVQEIESAILKLAPGQLSELSKWLDEHLERSWDARMEADAKAGKFDRFKQEIDRAKASGTLLDFP
jgi:fatty acid/phospholipid biosynthesis enzyme